MTAPVNDNRLDIEQVIRRAKLRNSRETQAVLMLMLFQEIHKRDNDAKFVCAAIVDEGRSVREVLYAVQHKGDLWTINGKGDWSWQMQRALARNSQTWKNPKLAPINFGEESDELSQKMLTEEFPLSAKTRTRINEAMSFVESSVISKASPKVEPGVRKSPRL